MKKNVIDRVYWGLYLQVEHKGFTYDQLVYIHNWDYDRALFVMDRCDFVKSVKAFVADTKALDDMYNDYVNDTVALFHALFGGIDKVKEVMGLE